MRLLVVLDNGMVCILTPKLYLLRVASKEKYEGLSPEDRRDLLKTCWHDWDKHPIMTMN